MRILHTADWHLGQMFHEYDRTPEHRHFLDWLLQTLGDEQIDVLLISGDVFDLSNPAAVTVSMFNGFLSRAMQRFPALQIIVTAGNHDSAARLESFMPLLENTRTRIVGLIEKDAAGKINYDKVTIPLTDHAGNCIAWCLAVPFLRIGDYPVPEGAANPYAEGVTAFYREAYEFVIRKKKDDQAVIAMGHLHAQRAEISDDDKSERQIMGGLESVSEEAFAAEIAYVALGHIHKAQRVGGREYIRYCGSPFPMSFSERKYSHQVLVFDLKDGKAGAIRDIKVPVAVPVMSVPEKHSPIEVVLEELAKLPAATKSEFPAPYLEVRVLDDKPDPSRRHRIEKAVEGRHVRLATINVKSGASVVKVRTEDNVSQKLDDLKPADLFSKIYQSRYGTAVPSEIMELFNDISQAAETQEQ